MSLYCCSSSCSIYCTTYYKIDQVCIIVDLVNNQVTNDGCLGGFGDQNLRYYKTEYTIGSSISNTVYLNVKIRDKNDPYYLIPFIIGFGADSTWGVTKMDNLIILIVFYIATAISFLINCCLIISLIVFIYQVYYKKETIQSDEKTTNSVSTVAQAPKQVGKMVIVSKEDIFKDQINDHDISKENRIQEINDASIEEKVYQIERSDTNSYYPPLE